VFEPMQLLGFLTHDLIKARYPDINSGFNPLAILTSDHPIIKHQYRLHELVEECLHKIDSMLV